MISLFCREHIVSKWDISTVNSSKYYCPGARFYIRPSSSSLYFCIDGGIPYNQKTMIQVRLYIEKVKEKEIKKEKKNYPFEFGIGLYLTFRKWWYIVCLCWRTLYSGISVYWDKNNQCVFLILCAYYSKIKWSQVFSYTVYTATSSPVNIV